MAHYPAFIHKEKQSCFGVSFPDFPGCISAGDTYEEAYSQAVEALRMHVDLMRDDGDEIPEPSALDAVLSAPDLADQREGATIAMVPLFAASGRIRRVNVSVDEAVLEAFDEAARSAGQTRSGLLTEAMRLALKDASTEAGKHGGRRQGDGDRFAKKRPGSREAKRKSA